MNEFTKGQYQAVIYYEQMDCRSREEPFKLMNHPAHHVECNGEIFCDLIEKIADAQLIVAAGTTATKLAEQGYDALKVLEMMPELVELVSHMDSSLGAVELLEQCTTGPITKHKAP